MYRRARGRGNDVPARPTGAGCRWDSGLGCGRGEGAFEFDAVKVERGVAEVLDGVGGFGREAANRVGADLDGSGREVRGGEEAEVAGGVEVEDAGPGVGVHGLDGVGRDGDVEDADLVVFKEDAMVSGSGEEGVGGTEGSGCGAAAGVFELEAEGAEGAVAVVPDGMGRVRGKVHRVGVILERRREGFAIGEEDGVVLVFQDEEE